jgi:hypothetical protein
MDAWWEDVKYEILKYLFIVKLTTIGVLIFPGLLEYEDMEGRCYVSRNSCGSLVQFN